MINQICHNEEKSEVCNIKNHFITQKRKTEKNQPGILAQPTEETLTFHWGSVEGW